MQARREPPLNEHGLFVHDGAATAINACLREGQVGSYPGYLVGLAMPEHRGGPALVALLTLPDGGVLGAAARSLRKQKVNGVLGYDVDYLDAGGLEEYRRIFYNEFGGFGPPCLDPSPTVAAEQLLRNAWLAVKFATDVGPSSQGPPDLYPSDWTDIVFYSQDAIGCVVEGFAPSPDVLASLDLPAPLKRALQLAPSSELAWVDQLHERLVAELHERIPPLVTESWALRLVSPQASVALLRSVAELALRSLVAPGKQPVLNRDLGRLEADWHALAPDSTPQGRREAAWRGEVLACFHTLRDLGNRIHADSVVESADLALAHESCHRLLEALLRAGPRDPQIAPSGRTPT